MVFLLEQDKIYPTFNTVNKTESKAQKGFLFQFKLDFVV